ncbi:glycoside hydrolase family 3 C-terminal domain-containing protein [Streptomyces sp. RY43-2]|uniref:Glycoside hydrolase family 3 C-terminal domain-containing protein n=1 Tax=Streptomyces macrolidinus TaxID=2952607 RepID=A0ABT0ZLA4_9ACTN|nr:glycoside hydrolase family 3 C-terminal domain-containing protein [Streptomyces macrolidinus]MCN9244370.1 glycoside hydrolase family 3 C-terminal domain-containing protein [Streptomyces macrolidinus]
MTIRLRIPGSRRRRASARTLTLAVVASLLAGTTVAAAAPGAGGPAENGAAQTSTVEDLVARMTLDEKLSFVHWHLDPARQNVGYLPGVPRLGIAELRSADGPNGIRLVGGTATALPAPIALASTFDDTLADSYGKVMGRDGRALGQDMVLGPMMNNIRVPHGGRNYETFSEDPLVSSRTAAAQIKGIQSQGLMTTAKHFAANNQENNRFGVNAKVDEQTLHEIELPAFEASTKAGAASFMCAYNGLNGKPSCGNDELLNGVLRAQWGFQGWVMSDWLATQSTDSITKGLDMEMGLELPGDIPPGAPEPEPAYFGAALKKAVQDGTIPVTVLDRSVERIVGQMERFGLVGGTVPARPERDRTGAQAVSQKVAENGAVLLRNQDGALPLTGDAGTSLAVIGPTAQDPKVTGLGSAHVVPDSAAAPLDTLRRRAGAGAQVSYEAGEQIFGSLIPDTALSPAFKQGKQLEPGENGTLYDGTLTVPADGEYRIAVRATGGYATVTLDDHVIEAGQVYGKVSSPLLKLAKGTHKLSMTGFAMSATPLSVDLGWVTPEAADASIARAVTAAKNAKTAVVFAYDDGTEGVDRPSLSLPGTQDKLISAVADANPNTVVVLNAGSSVLMPWLDKTRAVLDMWYPGQAGAEATAALLYGDVNPSGKLTQSFPAREDQHAVAGDPKRYPGVDNQQEYTEGIHVGYRWFDKEKVRPLFPFGHGLSYTSYTYGAPTVEPSADGGLQVTLTVRNTGQRAGQEVVQAYLGASPDVTAPQAVKKLVGYSKVALAPGEQKQVTLKVDRRQLQYWDTASHAWRTGTGDRLLQVGTSSADLKGSVTVNIAE